MPSGRSRPHPRVSVLGLRREGGHKRAAGLIDFVGKPVRAWRTGPRAQDDPRRGAPRRKRLVRGRAGTLTEVGLQEIL
eukprot:8223676-Alexandrium_andersonii.AAC.1